MFPKLKLNGKISLLADLVPYNRIIVKDHEPIHNEGLILRTLGRAKYQSTIDLADWSFQSTLEPECEKYNTIKTFFGSFICKVML
jgi:hypothetical protein